ncbi:MAG: beta-galactosidase [Candidatus Binataceae bacterium]
MKPIITNLLLLIAMALATGTIANATDDPTGPSSQFGHRHRHSPTPTHTATPTVTPTRTPTPTPTAAPSPGIINGIYDLGDVDSSTFASSVLSDPSVDGLAMRTTWQTLEPADGTFDWSEIDTAIATAQANGKKLSISVTPGVQTPSWLWTEGAQAFDYVWDKGYSFPYCTVVSIPVPWDPIYEAKWGAFVAALGARYDSNPTVSHVKLTGVNGPSQETSLPNMVNEIINNGQCTGYDDVQNWINLGYTRTLVENAWQQFAADFSTAFPQKQFAEMFNPCGLPPIDENGDVIADATCDYQGVTDIINYGIDDYGLGRFIGQNNALAATSISSVIVSDADFVNTGYQELEPLGSDFAAAATLAISDNAMFLEIYESDLTDSSNQSAITTAHNGLLAN